MTCQQLRLYFGDPLQRDAERRLEAELVVHDHLAHCSDCASFVEVQRELGTGLRLTREAVPTVPASLDDAALANYRKQIAERPGLASAGQRRHRFAVLCWSGAVAIVLASGILLFHGRKAVTTITQPRLAQSARAAQRPLTAAVAARVSKPKVLNPAVHRALRQTSVPSVTMLANPVPAAFRSLMYCDELSCGGTLDVIRVALPSSVTALAAASTSTNGVVFADVLVGPDGIARGIWILE